MIDHLDPTDDPRVQNHFRFVDRTLADDANIQRVPIATPPLTTQRSNAVAAVGAGDEAIEDRRLGRSALGTIDPQIAGHLVHLVLHQVKRRDFDIGVHQARRILADFQSMPRVRTPTVKCTRERHIIPPLQAPKSYVAARYAIPAIHKSDAR